MKTETLIIGAGPSGLAVAGQLRQAGLRFEIVEQADKVASKWHQHYDRLRLHTVKSLSSLPYEDFPNHYPKYVPKKQLIAYYESYAHKFKIYPHFNTSVTSITKDSEGWQFQCTHSKVFIANHVIIYKGLNRIPNIPTWNGQYVFTCDILHASAYKNPSAYQDKKVLVVGMGNTGADIALDLAEAGFDVSISVRSNPIIVPRDFMGSPVQITAKKLAKLPFGLGDFIGKMVRKIVFGNLDKYGLRMPAISPMTLRLKHGKTPTIDIGTVQKIKEGKIRLLKDIEEFKATSILFTDGHTENFDTLILATGYEAQIDSFLGNASQILNQHGEPKVKIGDGTAQGLYFMGYEKFTFGGILGTLKQDAALIVNDIKGMG